jgi:EmrB/QacA subfamily drug resistance transporter
MSASEASTASKVERTEPAVHKYWTLTAACLGTFMLLMDITIVIVALPSIRTSLHTSFSDVQWTIDAYSLSLASLLLPAGSLADILGRRRVFATGLAIFTLGSLLCGLATSGLMLVICRVFQGVGGATIFATSLALLAQTFQGKERGFAFGIWGGVVGAAGGIGPLLGGLLTTEISWRWIFFVNLPLGAIAIGITLTRVREGRPASAPRIDVPGFVLFTSGLFCLIYGLIESSRRGWGSGVVIGALILAVVLLTAFPLLERRRRDPMVDLRLFRKPAFVGGLVAAFGMNASLFAMFLYLTLYLQDGLHDSALGSGLRLAVSTLALTAAAIPAGRLSQHVPVRWLIGPGLVLVGAGLLLMRGITADSAWTHLLPGFIVAGIGAGMVNPPLASTAVGVVSPRDAGMASGLNSTLRQVGIATAVAALGSIFAHRIAHATPLTIHSDYASALNELLLIAALTAFVAGLVALALLRPRDFVPHGAPAAATEIPA